MNKAAIVILGAPGSGKGTQANLLSEKFGFYHLETSNLLEKIFAETNSKSSVQIHGQEYYLEKERKLWLTGQLCSLPFVFFQIQEKIKETFQRNIGVILSGSPRTLEEAKKLTPFLEDLYGKNNIYVFFLDISLEQSIWRNSHRRICKLMRHPILYNKETKGLSRCPLDGSELIRRKLDKPEIIRKRFSVFKKQTLPVLDYLKEQECVVNKINGEQSVADVFSDISKIL